MPVSFHNTLFVIPARGGSKGLPGKNIKPLAGKPLLHYTIDAARELADDTNICITTDDACIAKCAADYGLHVPFERPASLATDTAGTYEVLLHVLDFYAANERTFETLVLLQPTSPFRKAKHIVEAFELYSQSLDMVVSVTESNANPYFNMFEENPDGYLKKVKEGNYVGRQSCPNVYTYNGAVYIINVQSLKKSLISQFGKIVKYTMNELESTDIDTMVDWLWAEFLIEKKLIY